MAPRGRIEGRDAHQAMHAALGLQPAIGVLAADRDGRRFDAGFLARALFQPSRPCSRAARPSAYTCAAASRPSPAPRCRRRRHGPRDSSRWRRPRPTAGFRARAWPPRPAVAEARLRLRRRPLSSPSASPSSISVSASSSSRSRRLIRARSRRSRRVRSRITFCAAVGIVPESRDLRRGRSVRRGGRSGVIPVKDASSAAPATRGSRSPPLRSRHAWVLYASSLRR